MTNIIPIQRRDLQYIFKEISNYLTVEEAHAIINTCKNPRDKIFLKVLWETGVRVSEAIGIRVKDILDDGILIKGKGNKKRIVPIQSRLSDDLEMYIKLSKLKKDDRLFNFTRQNAFYIVQKNSSRAGIDYKKVHPHSFRHGFAVNFLKQRHNIVILQKLLGHSNITTTMIYLQLVQPDIKNEIELMQF